MSGSDKQVTSRRTRGRRSLVIRRIDHIGDPVGVAFLESPETDGDAVLARLREYLGDKLSLVRAEVSHDEIMVEVDSRGWSEEGTRMAAAARDLYAKGAKRSAMSMYRDALDLDPLNAEAMLRLGLVFAEQEKFGEALVALKHAREFGAVGAEMLVAMGQCAAGLERNASAIAYYEEALKLEPRNFVARRALSALGRKPGTKVKESGAVRSRRD
jgi:tetratricopeptide (TPR) repeat protein